MANYNLINPSIEGSLSTTFSGKSQLDAAVTAWNSISKYITNNVPQFAFTLENSNDGQLHHFLVKETLDGGNSASFDISEMDLKLNKKTETEFKKRSAASKSKMSGGKKHHKDDDDDSSSSSSSSEIFSALKLYKNRTRTYPISYWWYDPLVYRLDYLYMPTFVAPLSPYVEFTTINYYP